MDPSLLREHEAFMKRASTQHVIEKRKFKPSEKDEKKAKKPKPKPPPPRPSAPMDYKTAQGSSQVRFGVLAKIVKHMKSRHQAATNDPLLLEEILDETHQLDISSKMKHWLATESLLNNPKITVVKEDGVNKFCFKPLFNIQDKRGLVKLLKSYDLHGRGGILKEEIEESLPNADKILRNVADHVIRIQRPQDKKEVLFYNDRTCRLSIEEDFQKLWRSVAVEGLDEGKIEDYLNKQGISSMDAAGLRKVSSLQRRKKGKQRARTFKKHNDHLEGVLQDYTENPQGKIG